MTEREALEMKHVGIVVFAWQKDKLTEIARPRGFHSARELLLSAALLLMRNPDAAPWDELRAIACSDELANVNRGWAAHIAADYRKRKGAENA